MTRSIALLLLGICMIPAYADPPASFNWTLTFSDEFDGTTLDATKWNSWTSAANWQNEQECYQPAQNTVHDGSAWIECKVGPCTANNKPYASGFFESNYKQRFGYWEARMKLPRCQSLWTAFWLRGLPEFDIEELIQQGTGAPTNFASAYIVPAGYPSQCNTNSSLTRFWYQTFTPDLSAAFHVWGCYWYSDSARFFFDGKPVGQKITQYLEPACSIPIAFDVAVSGDYPMETARLPAYLQIDWVRCYQRGAVKVQPLRGEASVTAGAQMVRQTPGGHLWIDISSFGNRSVTATIYNMRGSVVGIVRDGRQGTELSLDGMRLKQGRYICRVNVGKTELGEQFVVVKG